MIVGVSEARVRPDRFEAFHDGEEYLVEPLRVRHFTLASLR
ncbi:hypothetical protein ACIPQA_09330 [Streptomyces sp. NPDC090109]|nr:hypothetical protein [Streptomyces sp. SID5770]